MLKYLIKKNKFDSFAGFVTLFLFALNRALLSGLILYDMSIVNGKIEFKLLSLILINGLYMLYYFLTSYLSEYYLDKFMIKSQHTLNNDLYKAVLKNDVEELSKSNISSMFTNDIPLISETYIQGIINSVYFIVSFFFSAILIFSINIYMLIYLVLVSVLTMIGLKRLIKALSNKQYDYNKSLAVILKKINETINNLSYIRIYNLKNKFEKDFNNLSSESIDNLFGIAFQEDKIEVINQTSATLIEVGMYVLGVILIYNNEIEISSLVALVASAEAITLPIYSFSRVVSKFEKTKTIRKKLMHTIRSTVNNNKKEIETIEQIEIFNFQSKYVEKRIHKPINTVIEKGKKYAIVGDNGSGKSTFINTIIGEKIFYDGKILINKGIYLSDIDIERFSHRISYVSQSNILLEETIKNNIILENAFDESKYNSIIRKLSLDHLDGEILICEGQSNLSGGEQQKLMIARALYKESDLIILDEPFAYMDADSSQELLRCLLEEERTVLVIIHKLDQEARKEFDGIIELNRI